MGMPRGLRKLTYAATLRQLEHELEMKDERIAELEAECDALRSALRDIGKQNVRGEPYVWQYANKVLGRFTEGPTLLEQLAELTRERDDERSRVQILQRDFVERGEIIRTLRKIAAHVPARIYMKAKEDAGHGQRIELKAAALDAARRENRG